MDCSLDYCLKQHNKQQQWNAIDWSLIYGISEEIVYTQAMGVIQSLNICVTYFNFHTFFSICLASRNLLMIRRKKRFIQEQKYYEWLYSVPCIYSWHIHVFGCNAYLLYHWHSFIQAKHIYRNTRDKNSAGNCVEIVPLSLTLLELSNNTNIQFSYIRTLCILRH